MLTVWRMVHFESGEIGWSGELMSRRKPIATLQLTFNPKLETGLILLGLEVLPQWRGQGYAKLLMDQVEADFSDRFSEILLAVEPFGDRGLSRKELEEFYKRRGFEHTGRSTANGSVIMRKTI